MGLMNPDQKTFDYVKGREAAPKGEKFEEAIADWKTLVSDPDAEYDKVITIDVSDLAPMVIGGQTLKWVLNLVNHSQKSKT